MTKLEEAEALGRGTMRGRVCRGDVEVLVKEVDRLREKLREAEGVSHACAEQCDDLRAELAALKGEGARTVYVAAGGMHGAVDEMLNRNSHTFAADALRFALPGESVWAVRTTARKVTP